MHQLAFPMLVTLVAMALAFDFLNGLHDAANSIATVVSTQLLSPMVAVAFAAVGNFLAYWIVGLHVAETVGSGIIDKDVVTPAVVFGALGGAMSWNVLTWLKGLPSSSSHALIGGLLGAGIAHRGFSAVESAGTSKTMIAIVLSPMIGFAIAMLLMLLTSMLFQRTRAGAGEPHVQGVAPRFFGGAVDQSRRQRCAKDDGRDCRAALFDRSPGREVPRSGMGRAELLRGHVAGHAVGRLANHPDDGHTPDPAQPPLGILRV